MRYRACIYSSCDGHIIFLKHILKAYVRDLRPLWKCSTIKKKHSNLFNWNIGSNLVHQTKRKYHILTFINQNLWQQNWRKLPIILFYEKGCGSSSVNKNHMKLISKNMTNQLFNVLHTSLRSIRKWFHQNQDSKQVANCFSSVFDIRPLSTRNVLRLNITIHVYKTTCT